MQERNRALIRINTPVAPLVHRQFIGLLRGREAWQSVQKQHYAHVRGSCGDRTYHTGSNLPSDEYTEYRKYYKARNHSKLVIDKSAISS